MILTGPALRERFQALDDFLVTHQELWRPKPFSNPVLPWETKHPELGAWLRGRSLEQAEAEHNHPEHLQAPYPFRELAASAATLAAVGELPAHELGARHARLDVDVPGRKWQQIEAFASRLHFQKVPNHWLDWCAGKGHLGRLLAQGGQQLTCLEYDEQLVAAGQRLSERLHMGVQHMLQDVLDDDAATHLSAGHSPVALHACGDLHVRLMQLASAAGCTQLAIAPCCYNRTGHSHYQPLSMPAQHSPLRLSLDDLRLPMAETVTAGQRQRRQRDHSMAWRLAFDQLQRQQRSPDEYLPTPSLPISWLNKDFSDYCRDLAELKGIKLHGDIDWHTLEAAGWRRLAEVRNLELVRGLFRRPLEMWLLLDRALYLEEQGYRVRLGTFCPRSLTPRNLLLLAERS
ncbi:methyltransferase [Pseudomonas sp. PDM16]|uniref:methyltransferase n=1 Tax=Pseudomonas sp. PDM16 TaxID=2769292 RepID=UPI0017828ADF|nr:methyltransferase [Pseudomonas sp. PDM16]MBD9413880.1 methyltransferase [Pseudomonas sp. PDM16]